METALKDIKNSTGVVEVNANIVVTEKLTKSATPKPYLELIFSQGSDSITCNIWSDNINYVEYKEIPNNSLVCVSVEYKGMVKGYDKYEVKNIKKIIKPSLIDCVDINALKVELGKVIELIDDEEIHDIIYKTCHKRDISKRLVNAPLTEKGSYSFRGGTLAHIIRSSYLAKAIVDTYNAWNFNKEGINIRLDLSTILFGVFFHDLGALNSFYVEDEKVVKTFNGDLNEKSFEGSIILMNALADSKMTQKKKDLLIHVATSANGSLSFGALNTPRTKEAEVLHDLDRMDSVMGTFEVLQRMSVDNQDFATLNQKRYCLTNMKDV